MTYIETKTGSYAYSLERPEELESTASQIVYSTIKSTSIPEVIDPSPWTKIEDQASQGACAGHSASSCAEWLHTEAGGDYVQLSRAMAYYETQRIDNIRGDRGSTIAGGVKLLETRGIVKESAWPYPARYNPTRPSGLESETHYKTESHSMLKSYEDLIKHLSLYLPIHTGFMWGNGIDRQASRDGILRSFTPGGGGHSVMWLGYRRTDWNGNALPGDDPYPILWNSWSKRWGNKGRVLVAPSFVRQVLGHRWSAFAGLHGKSSPEPTQPDYGEL